MNLVVDATDRQGLLRDISEVLSREKINVTAVKTTSRKDGTASMNFTIELIGTSDLHRVASLLREVQGVFSVKRV